VVPRRERPNFEEARVLHAAGKNQVAVEAAAALPLYLRDKVAQTTAERAAVRAAVSDPQFMGAMAKVSTPINYLDAPEFKEFWVTDAARLRTAVLKIGKSAGK